MSVTLVDTNILLDLFTQDQKWRDWSALQVEDAITHGRIAINDVIYAELSVWIHANRTTRQGSFRLVARRRAHAS